MKKSIQVYKIIFNSHPGYIPNCRGLDAFKWAIYDNQPIGVTTHLIGEYVDAGYIIERRIIKVKQNDTIHSLAYRVYENEISMLVEAIKLVENELVFINPDNYIVHKRMPNEYEKVLLQRFEEVKKSDNSTILH